MPGQTATSLIRASVLRLSYLKLRRGFQFANLIVHVLGVAFGPQDGDFTDVGVLGLVLDVFSDLLQI